MSWNAQQQSDLVVRQVVCGYLCGKRTNVGSIGEYLLHSQDSDVKLIASKPPDQLSICIK